MMTSSKQLTNTKMLSAAMLRLLPIQVLMLAVASLNSLISGWFAANYVGENAMSANWDCVSFLGWRRMFSTRTSSASTYLLSGYRRLRRLRRRDRRNENL